MGSLWFQQQRFGDGVPLPVGAPIREILTAEQGIHRHEGGIEPFQVDDGAAGKIGHPPEVLRAEIDPGGAVQPGEQGESVGAADEGTGGVEEAAFVHEQGARAVRCRLSCPVADHVGLIGGKPVQCHGEGHGFNRQKGQVPAAPGASGSADDLFGEFLADAGAQLVHPADQIPVIFQQFMG